MVGVDQPIKALSMHIRKPYKEIIVLVLIAFILSIFFFQPDSFMHIVGSFTKPRTCTLVNFTGETKTFIFVCVWLYSCEVQTEIIF